MPRHFVVDQLFLCVHLIKLHSPRINIDPTIKKRTNANTTYTLISIVASKGLR